MNCKNCGQIVNGKFCRYCGQNSKVGKINLSIFLEEISSNVFQIDKGIIYTLKELLVRPGTSINDYLNGKRKNYFKPVAYVLTLSTLYFLTSRLFGESTWMNDIISGFSLSSSDSESNTDVPFLLTWLAENFAYAALFFLPVFSFASYISFSGLGRNYLEHLVLNSYVTGQQAVFYSLLIIPKSYFDIDILELIPVLISVLYAFWVFWQFFSEGSRIINIFRSVLTYFLYMIFGMGILFVILVIQKF